jgi:hypothetical protein
MTTHATPSTPCRVCRGTGRLTVGTGRGQQLTCPTCRGHRVEQGAR